jgi:hypothetical protein
MNGMDVDWERTVSDDMTQPQFQILFSTIRQVFDQQPLKYYLSFTPAWPTDTIDYPAVYSAFDFVAGSTTRTPFTQSAPSGQSVVCL